MSNEILQFGETDTGTNLLTQAEYVADAQRLIGNQPGIARAKLVNKAIRQATFVASALAEFVATKTGSNVLDNADRAALVTLMTTALRFTPSISTKTSSYTITANDDTIFADGTSGAFTLTLPSASSNTGKLITIKRTDLTLANLITISGSINGGSNAFLSCRGETITLQSDGTTWQAETVSHPMKAVITHELASGTSPGTVSTGSSQTHPLNTLSNPNGVVKSLTSNQFTLTAGTYVIKASSMLFRIASGVTWIYNITDAAIVSTLIGNPVFSETTTVQNSNTIIQGILTITATKTFELQAKVQVTASDGWGRPANLSTTEVFASIEIQKIKGW